VSDETKAYKLFDPITKNVIIGKDMIFKEDKSWNWDKGRVESTPTTLDMDYQDEEEIGQEEEESDNVEVTPQRVEESGNVELTPPLIATIESQMQQSESVRPEKIK